MPSESRGVTEVPGAARAGDGAIEDPRAIIAREPMHRTQLIVVAICVALIALDGFDVLAISFASPGIAAEWGIDRTTLGFVLSMELIGMAIGSVSLGSVADRVGRRPMILGCLVVMTVGMLLATTANDVTELSIYRSPRGSGSVACSPRPMRWPPSSRTTAAATCAWRSWRRAIRWARSLAA